MSQTDGEGKKISLRQMVLKPLSLFFCAGLPGMRTWRRESSGSNCRAAALAVEAAVTPAPVTRPLACLSHHPTVEARHTTAMTSLRLLAVLNVLSSTPARAKRLAPRPDSPLTHFTSPRGEKCRLGFLRITRHGTRNTDFIAVRVAMGAKGSHHEKPRAQSLFACARSRGMARQGAPRAAVRAPSASATRTVRFFHETRYTNHGLYTWPFGSLWVGKSRTARNRRRTAATLRQVTASLPTIPHYFPLKILSMSQCQCIVSRSRSASRQAPSAAK